MKNCRSGYGVCKSQGARGSVRGALTVFEAGAPSTGWVFYVQYVQKAQFV